MTRNAKILLAGAILSVGVITTLVLRNLGEHQANSNRNWVSDPIVDKVSSPITYAAPQLPFTGKASASEKVVFRLLEIDSQFYAPFGFLDFRFDSTPIENGCNISIDYTGEVQTQEDTSTGSRQPKTKLFFEVGKLKCITRFYYGDADQYLAETIKMFGFPAKNRSRQFDTQGMVISSNEVRYYSFANSFVIVHLRVTSRLEQMIAVTVVERDFIRRALLENLGDLETEFVIFRRLMPVLEKPDLWSSIKSSPRIYLYCKIGDIVKGRPVASIRPSIYRDMVYAIIPHMPGSIESAEANQANQADWSHQQKIKLYPIHLRQLFFDSQAHLAQALFALVSDVQMMEGESEMESRIGITPIGFNLEGGWQVLRLNNGDWHFFLPFREQRKL